MDYRVLPAQSICLGEKVGGGSRTYPLTMLLSSFNWDLQFIQVGILKGVGHFYGMHLRLKFILDLHRPCAWLSSIDWLWWGQQERSTAGDGGVRFSRDKTSS